MNEPPYTPEEIISEFAGRLCLWSGHPVTNCYAALFNGALERGVSREQIRATIDTVEAPCFPLVFDLIDGLVGVEA